MGKVIAFINFKGGVGKTSNAVNLGAVLAQSHGKKVLLVDLDAQCNSTFWLLGNAERKKLMEEHQRTTCQIFRDHLLGTHIFDFDSAVFSGVPRSPAGNPCIATLDLLPAHVDLLEIEDQLSGRTPQPYFTFLERTLKPYVKHYDFLLLDCPPNIYNVSKNALHFADYYIVPYVPDFLSLSGLRTFAKVVRRFQDQASGVRTRHARPLLAGVVVNRYKKIGNVFSQAISELELEIGDLRAQKLVHEKAQILAPFIRDCVGVAECSNYHLPVTVHKPDAIGADDYRALAMNFLDFIDQL